MSSTPFWAITISHGLVLSGANFLEHISPMISAEKPAITRLGADSEDFVFFIVYSVALYQGWVHVLSH